MATAPGALASTESATHLSATLNPLNGSGASGHVSATLRGNVVRIGVTSTGMAPGLPHAQHIHIGGTHTCPLPTQKGKGVDGHLRATDAGKSNGPVKVSLTTSGDTSAASVLAVKRFPVGDASYSRVITVPAGIAAQIRAGLATIDLHGVDYNKDGKYDGAARSDLNPALPEEATDPALCGVLAVNQMNTTPTGGVNTGYPETGSSTNYLALGGGAAAVAIGGTGFVLLRRRKDGTV